MASMGPRRANQTRGSPMDQQSNALEREIITEWVNDMNKLLDEGRIPYDPMTPEEWEPLLRKHGYSRLIHTLGWIAEKSYCCFEDLQQQAHLFGDPYQTMCFRKGQQTSAGHDAQPLDVVAVSRARFGRGRLRRGGPCKRNKGNLERMGNHTRRFRRAVGAGATVV